MTTVTNDHAGRIDVRQTTNPIKLYPHQEAAIKELEQMLKATSSTGFSGLLVLPTGGGKTLTAVFWLLRAVLDQHHKVLWIAHRHKLLDQALIAFSNTAYRNLLPNRTAFRYRILSGQHDKPVNIRADDDVLIASKDSLNHGMHHLHSKWLSPQTPVFLVIDEAHHATAKTYRKVIDAVQEHNQQTGHPFRMLGLTATPFRTTAKEQGLLGKLFADDIVYKIDLRTLVSQGILADPIFEELHTQMDMTSSLSDKDIRTIQSFDTLPEDLAVRIAESKERNHRIVQHYIANKQKFGPLLVFALNIEHAITLDALFRQAGVRSAYVVSSIKDMATGVTISAEENQRKIEDFRNGKLDVLVNVTILTEGVDLPNVQTVFLTRPTVSTILMTQMIGRALRGVQAGGTPHAYIVSFIDDWKDKINWVNPEKITIETSGDFIDGKSGGEKQITRMVAIDKIAEFAAMMDESIDTSALEKLTFLERLPVGVYVFSVLLPAEQGDSLEKHCDVLVFDNIQPAYEAFINDLETLVSYEGLADTEFPDEEDLARLCEEVEATYFDGPHMLPGYRPEDIRDMLRYYAQKGEAPIFLPFKERAACDLSKIANYLYTEPLTGKQEAAYTDAQWDDPHAFWKLLFSHNKNYFIRQVSIEIERLKHPELFVPQPHTDNIEHENIDISHLSLHEMRKKTPAHWYNLREAVFAKHTDADGMITCAISGYRSTSRIYFQIDHIKPMSQGGLSTLDNLQILTRWENAKKSDMLPPVHPISPPARTNISNAHVHCTLRCHTKAVNRVAFSPDGTIIASASDDQSVQLRRTTDGTLIHSLAGDQYHVNAVAFSPDGEHIATGSGLGLVRLWRVADGSPVWTSQVFASRVRALAFSPNGADLAIATGSSGKTAAGEARLVDVETGDTIHTFANPTNAVCHDIAFGPDWRIAAGVLVKGTGRVCLWNTFNGQERFPIKHATIGANSIFCVAFSPDGETLVSGWRGDIQAWRTADGTHRYTCIGTTVEQIASVAFAPTGDVLVSGSSAGHICLWRVADQTLIRTLGTGLANIRSVAVSPDGALIASAHDDGTVRLWATASG